MKKQVFTLKTFTYLTIASLAFASCSTDSNEDIFGIGEDDTVEIIDENGDVITPAASEFDGEISVFNTGADQRSVTIDAATVTDGVAQVKVAFKSATNRDMRRLYVTQNINATGDVPYNFELNGVTVDDKKDGSLDLASASRNEFEFKIPFNAPTTANSEIVYTIWATTGRGDFRDFTKRNAIDSDIINGVGTIKIVSGSGMDMDMVTGIRNYTTTILSAPLASGQSETFISLFNGQKYRINEGTEFAALWDFGYYYGNTDKASLASASNYPSFFDTDNDGMLDSGVAGISGVPQEELNNCFFRLSNKTVAEFDNATSEDLAAIVRPASERVKSLAVNNVVEFVDEYGKKGLIKVTNINSGFGTNGSITIEIKVEN